MRIGIYGGSFSPPHIGHTMSAKAAVAQLSLDKLIVIPSGTPPHKTLPEGGPTARQRFEMTQLAFADVLCVEVSDIELHRPGESYTVDTARELRGVYPEDELFLLLGTDMFLTLHEWKKTDELLTYIKPAVAFRSQFDLEAVRARAEQYKALGTDVFMVENEAIDISSSELRGLLPKRALPWHIDERVYSYIIEHRLYGARSDFDRLRRLAYQMLDLGRIRHVAGCEESAVMLAVRWGADVNDAREAAILHDITKRAKLEEQLELCEKYNAQVDDEERGSEKLLHSKTAAAYAMAHFAVSSDVKQAIMWHTTGRADMSLLEKIIYIADYIEPNRDFEGIAEMRELAFRDLDRALLMGIEMSLKDLISRGISPHKNSLEAAEFIRKGIK